MPGKAFKVNNYTSNVWRHVLWQPKRDETIKTTLYLLIPSHLPLIATGNNFISQVIISIISKSRPAECGPATKHSCNLFLLLLKFLSSGFQIGVICKMRISGYNDSGAGEAEP